MNDWESSLHHKTTRLTIHPLKAIKSTRRRYCHHTLRGLVLPRVWSCHSRRRNIRGARNSRAIFESETQINVWVGTNVSFNEDPISKLSITNTWYMGAYQKSGLFQNQQTPNPGLSECIHELYDELQPLGPIRNNPRPFIWNIPTELLARPVTIPNFPEATPDQKSLFTGIKRFYQTRRFSPICSPFRVWYTKLREESLALEIVLEI